MDLLTAIQQQEAREAQTVVDNIVILQELKQFIPPLSPEESRKLESNILAEGIRDSLILWKTTNLNYYTLDGLLPENYESTDYSGNKEDLEGFCYILIDGHNRYSIAKKHNIAFSFDIYEFDNIGVAKQFMINLQLGRRNLTKEQISYFRGLEYQNLKQQHGGTREKEATYQNDNLKDNLTTAQTVAAKHKVGEATVLRNSKFTQAIDIIGFYNPDLKNKILSREVKVNHNALELLPIIKEHRILHADNFASAESLDELLSKPIEVWDNGEVKKVIQPKTAQAKEKDFWKKQAEADKQSTIDFFDRVGEEREPEPERPVEQGNKEVERLKFDLDFYKEQSEYYQKQLNETQDELYNIQKSFQTNSADERIKLAKKGFKLMRCNDKKITFFDSENYSWKLFEKFDTKSAAQERMKELKEDEMTIFE